MKVLTLRQPYPAIIVLGLKTIETRSWRAPVSLIGERIAVHAAVKRIDHCASIGRIGLYRQDVDRMLVPGSVGPTPDFDWHEGATWVELIYGSIIATARLAGCLPMLSSTETMGLANKPPRSDHVVVGADGRWLRHAHYYEILPGQVGWRYETIDAQLPYGDYQPGRWAWMLADVEPLAAPVPFKGGQRLSKSWEPAA